MFQGSVRIDNTELDAAIQCDVVDFLFILTASSTFSAAQWQHQKAFFASLVDRIDASQSRFAFCGLS